MKLSVVINFYNMRREAARSLYALSVPYQRGVSVEDYEVLVVENGSSDPLTEEFAKSFGPNFRYFSFPPGNSSPVPAINAAVAQASGDSVMILIDGAHISSPGVIAWALRALRAFDDPFVAVMGFHLGPDVQNVSIGKGYDREAEDRLLAEVDWESNGYALFRVAGYYAYNLGGWFGVLGETNCFTIRTSSYHRLGGLDDSFTQPGGGLAILDLHRRAVSDERLDYVVLLGEGTFHQVHGGVASNASFEEHPWERFHEEYEALRGVPYSPELRRPHFLGSIPAEAAVWTRFSTNVGLRWWVQNEATDMESISHGLAVLAAEERDRLRAAGETLVQSPENPLIPNVPADF